VIGELLAYEDGIRASLLEAELDEIARRRHIDRDDEARLAEEVKWRAVGPRSIL
jgi:hypothetical protein